MVSVEVVICEASNGDFVDASTRILSTFHLYDFIDSALKQGTPLFTPRVCVGT